MIRSAHHQSRLADDSATPDLAGHSSERMFARDDLVQVSAPIPSPDKAISSSWIAEAGKYTVKVGASAKDIKLNGTFTLGKSLTLKKETVALVPKVKIEELKPR